MDVKILQDLLYVVVIAVVPVVSKFFIDYLQSTKERVDSNRTSDYFKDTESKAVSLIQNVVDTISQTYVDSLKNSGTFDSKKQKEAFNKALTKTKELMNDEMLEFISTAYVDTDKWITIQIESYIKTTKLEDKSSDNSVSKAIPIVDISNIMTDTQQSEATE